jgi:hypothetical protein
VAAAHDAFVAAAHDAFVAAAHDALKFEGSPAAAAAAAIARWWLPNWLSAAAEGCSPVPAALPPDEPEPKPMTSSGLWWPAAAR